MDPKNRFHTEQTWRWVRIEHLAIIAASVALLLLHFPEIRWARLAVPFVLIDLVGYIPGAIAYRQAANGRIAPIYHHLYNITHSYIVAGCVVLIWALFTGGFEWAMLAFPIHLSGDRGIFGNTFKPYELPFEPTTTGKAPSAQEQPS
jgi:hypothetical protein